MKQLPPSPVDQAPPLVEAQVALVVDHGSHAKVRVKDHVSLLHCKPIASLCFLG